MRDFSEIPLVISANFESLRVDNYDANVLTSSMSDALDPHSAARRQAFLANAQEQLAKLTGAWLVDHATTLNENAAFDNITLQQLTWFQNWMECSVMAAATDAPEVTKVTIGRTEKSTRKDVLESYKSWYDLHARSLSDQFFEVSSEMIYSAVAAAGPRALVWQGEPTPDFAYPNWRCLIEQPKQPCGFAVAFNFICPKKKPIPRRK